MGNLCCSKIVFIPYAKFFIKYVFPWAMLFNGIYFWYGSQKVSSLDCLFHFGAAKIMFLQRTSLDGLSLFFYIHSVLY